MGIYIYRVTKHQVELTDGSMANVAIYAYKPTYTGWGSEKDNAKAHLRTGCISSEAMAKRGNITGRIVMAYGQDGKHIVDQDAPVYDNAFRQGSFPDCDLGDTPFPRVKDVRPVSKSFL